MLKIDLNLVYIIINLIVLYFLLRHFLITPVTEIMEKRKKLIEDGFKNAQEAQENALRMQNEYEEALKGAKQESAVMIEKAQAAAKREYERIVNEADEKAGNMVEAAKETIRVERERTMKALQSEIAGLAVASAAKLVGAQAGKGGEQEMYSQFLEEVGGNDEDTEHE